jgi:integrase
MRLIVGSRHIQEFTEMHVEGSNSVATPCRLNFTKKAIGQLKAPTDPRYAYHYDTQVRGLGLRLSRTGGAVFVLYRKIAGRPERVTIGPYPDVSIEQARARAQEMNSAIARGENPSDDRRAIKAEHTLGDLFDIYLEHHAKQHKKTWADDVSAFNKHLHGWRLRKLSAVRTSDITALHVHIGQHRGRYAANRIVELLSSMFNRAREWGWKGENPAARVKPFRERKRERFLQPEELPAFFAALAEEQNETFRDYALISLLTGARRANVQAMRWSDISFTRAVWHIPETKNGEAVDVPLIEHALAILEAGQANAAMEAKRKKRALCDWVFPGRGRTGHLVEPKRAWASLLQRAGLADLRLHDLRRTLGSWQASTGASLIVIGKTLGHLNASTTQIYARLNLDPVRGAVQKATDAMLLAGGVSPRFLKGEK